MNKKIEQQKEFTVFAGAEFSIEWYFDAKGRSAALEYFDALDNDAQIKSLGLFELLGNMGTIKNKTKFNYEGDKIYAFKPQPHRFLCFFFSGSKIIITNAFHKKTDKLPIGEKNKALKYKKDYEERVTQGDYYD